MIDLMEKYAEAKFGKEALFGLNLGEMFGSIDPKKKAIRDRIEDLIRTEQRKKRLAQEAVDYGKKRLAEAGEPSTLGWASDITRSLIPGLSISASEAVEVLVKKSQDPDEGLGGRLFDLAHAGAAAGGAGLGYAAQTGGLGDVGTVTRLAKKLGKPLSGELGSVLGKGMSDIGKKHPEILALAAQNKGKLSELADLISPTFWKRQLTGGITSPEAARKFISDQMIRSGAKPERALTAMTKLKGMLRPSVGALTGPGALTKRIKLPGKWGAILGALAVSAPFALARLFKTRQLRASGGTAGQAAVSKAKELLSGAEQAAKERGELMTQLG